MAITISVELSIPQLDALGSQLTTSLQALGDRMADIFDPIRTAIQSSNDAIAAAITAEMTQLRATIEANQNLNETQVQALAEEINTSRDRLVAQIQNMVPDIPPGPEPPPTP